MRQRLFVLLASLCLFVSQGNSQDKSINDRKGPIVRISSSATSDYADLQSSPLDGAWKNSAQPATVHIVPGIYQTIQAAIYAADEGDTVLVLDGTYTGFGNKDLYFYGRNIVLRSQNGPDVTIINCEGDGRGINMTTVQDSTTIIQGFTIMGGYVVDESGGGIFVENASPTFVDCTIDTNYTNRNGGGAYLSNSGAVFEQCRFLRNHATWSGGGAYSGEGLAEFVECEFADNESHDTGGGFAGTGVLTDCHIMGNSAWSQGGGVDVLEGTYTRCVIEENLSGDGGGIGVAGSADFQDCRIIGNNAEYGGGVKVYPRCNPIFDRCVISGNLGVLQGGGIVLHIRDFERPVFTNCSVVGNASGTRGGGGIHVYSSMGGALKGLFEKSIVWGNCSTGPGDEVYVTCTSAGTGLEFACCDLDSTGFETDGCGTITYLGDNFFVNPQFCEMTDCDLAPTSTGDLRLSGTSPCLASNSPCLQLVGAIDSTCTGTAVEERPAATPSPACELYQNHPNPFNPTTTITFLLPEPTAANLSVYNIEGKLVAELADGRLSAGVKSYSWDGRDSGGNSVASGVYFYRLTAGDQMLTRKMVLLK